MMMNNKFKAVLATVLVIVVAVVVVVGVSAKEQPPPPEKMKKLEFPDFKEFTTDNGIETIVVEHKEQPVVTVYCVIKSGDSSDPKGKESLASFVADQINKGTKTRTALELAEWIESVGGRVSSGSETDNTYVSVTILSDYVDVAYAYLADILLNPVFPDDELDISRKQAKTGLEFELSDPNAMARRHVRELVYGDHPYAKEPTVESIESVTRDDLVDFHKHNYVANNALFAVVGDVKWKDVRKALNEHFDSWAQGTPDKVEYTGAPEAGETKIYLYHRPGSVQTEVWVAQLAPDSKNPDWPALVVGNRILGGGSDARLFYNLREEKGWTYGAYSGFSTAKDLRYFTAHMACRTEVTDSALVELMGEIERIKKEPVSEEDLENAKSYLIGNFPIQIETPNQLASRITQNKLLGRDKQYLETYRDRLAAVTIQDVSRVMDEYLHPSHSYVVLVGDATEIQEGVAATGIGDIALFDIAGEPLSLADLAIEPVSYEYDTSMLTESKATYALTAQGYELGDIETVVAKKSSEGREVVEVTSKLAGMITLDERTVFDAATLSPIEYARTMQAGPNKLNAELAFSDGGVTGTVQTPDSPEPKEVTASLVDGAIIDGSVEYALACLPLELNASYRFPAVLSDSGTLANLTAEVLEVVDLETPAGNFSTFKVKVQRPEGDMFFFLDKAAPHVLVQMEVPAQAMKSTLKSLTKSGDSAAR